jgi:hypothetical protein
MFPASTINYGFYYVIYQLFILDVTDSALHYVTFSNTPLLRYILDALHSCPNFHITRKD